MWPGMVVVATESDRVAAEVIAGVLRSEGIQAEIAADDGGNTNPELDFTRGVRVLVPEADEAKARELLKSHRDVGRSITSETEPGDPEGV